MYMCAHVMHVCILQPRVVFRGKNHTFHYHLVLFFIFLLDWKIL